MRDFLAMLFHLGLYGSLIGDIHEHTDELVQRSCFIEMRTDSNPDPADVTVRMDHTNVSCHGSAFPCPPQCGYRHTAIFWVHCRKKNLSCKRNVVGNAEHCPAVLGSPQFVRRPVELPQSDVHRVGDECHAVLAFLERALGLPSPTPLNKQRDKKSRLQGKNCRNHSSERTVLLPQAWFVEQDIGAGWKSTPFEMPSIQGPGVHAEGLRRTNFGWECSWILAVADLGYQVGYRGAVRFKRLD